MHAGEHEAIIDEALWQAVQAKVAEIQTNHKGRRTAREPSLLPGILKDGLDRRMTPSHATKGRVRYRYYVTHQDAVQPGQPSPWRLPAKDLELTVVERLRSFFADPAAIQAALGSAAGDGGTFCIAMELAGKVVEQLGMAQGRRSLVGKLLTRVIAQEQSVVLTVDTAALGWPLSCELPEGSIELIASTTRVRHGKDVKLVLRGEGGAAAQRDTKLVALLAEAIEARGAMLAEPERTLRDCASPISHLTSCGGLPTGIIPQASHRES